MTTRPALDVPHLVRQTFGDRALERELLALFEQQVLRLAPILAGDGPAAERADAAHTLRGAAAAIGARQVAALSGLLEAALDGSRGDAVAARVAAKLERALGEAHAAVADRWRAAA